MWVFVGSNKFVSTNIAGPASYHCAMDTRLLELLVCPVTKGPLSYKHETQELVSRSARLAYPVRDGIPVLLENEARVLTDAELEEGR